MNNSSPSDPMAFPEEYENETREPIIPNGAELPIKRRYEGEPTFSSDMDILITEEDSFLYIDIISYNRLVKRVIKIDKRNHSISTYTASKEFCSKTRMI